MDMTNGGSLVIHALQQAGVECIFGLHGAHIDSIFQAALDADLKIIDVRHEAAAGHAAEGWARLSGKTGVALVTAGGGFTNVVTSIANAWRDRTAVVYITGSAPLREDETNSLQGDIDQVAVAGPITKWAHRVVDCSHIPRLVAQAFRIAQTAPRGPVLLDIPWDILTREIDADAVDPFGCATGSTQPFGDPAVLNDALGLLLEAERPVVVVGGEAVRSCRPGILKQFALHTGIPVFADFEGLALLRELPENLRGGLIQGLYGFAQHDCAPDAVLMLGIRFGLNTAHGSGTLVPHTATTIQIDPDPRELGRLQRTQLAIVADPGSALAQLHEMSSAHPPCNRGGWKDRVINLIRAREDAILLTARGHDGALHPAIASRVISDYSGGDTAIVADGALTYLWLSEFLNRSPLRAFLCHGFLGSMGVGFGTAIGAQAAASQNGERVILVTGDGAVGFSIAEFDTLVRHGLPAIVVIMNNRSWGATMHFQQMVSGPNRVTGTRLENGSYAEVASAFGVMHAIVRDEKALRSAMAEALAGSTPACIEVMVSSDPIPPEELILMGRPPF